MDKDRTPSDPPGTASRRAALRLLDAVLRKGLPLEARWTRRRAISSAPTTAPSPTPSPPRRCAACPISTR